ncbi:MAG: SHOCT domain-containing protein [Silicimonas sp.]
MKIVIPVATPSALVLSAGSAFAGPSDGWGDSFGHMMWGGGFGMAGGLMMLLFWGAIIALIVFAVRGFSTGSSPASKPDAAEILRERYAKGEIDDEEYERRKAQLEK